MKKSNSKLEKRVFKKRARTSEKVCPEKKITEGVSIPDMLQIG
jgi:hypothetical protein